MSEVRDLNRDILRGRAVRRLYDFPQPNAPISVKEYLMAMVDGERCCLLRWALQDNITIDKMTYNLVQLDLHGDELETVEVTHLGHELPPTQGCRVFTPAWGVPLSPQCVSVRVRLTEVVSGAYTYHVSPNGLTVDYAVDEAWRYDPRAAKKDKLTAKVPFRIRSKVGNRVRGVWPFALLMVLVLIVVLSAPYLVVVIDFERLREIITDFINRILPGGEEPVAGIVARILTFTCI